MKTHFILGALVFLVACLFSCSAFAQADKTGFILRGGLEIPIYSGASISLGEDDSGIGGLMAVGPGLDIAIGYRWMYFGLLLEQQVGVVFATDKALKARWKGDDPLIDKGTAIFLGATYFLMEEYIPIGSECMITIGQGLGASYGSGKNMLYVTETDAAFAFKLELGFTYFLLGQHGIGFNFEWAGSLAFDEGISFSATYNPMLTYTAIF